jgi:hypothetical protein
LDATGEVVVRQVEVEISPGSRVDFSGWNVVERLDNLLALLGDKALHPRLIPQKMTDRVVQPKESLAEV